MLKVEKFFVEVFSKLSALAARFLAPLAMALAARRLLTGPIRVFTISLPSFLGFLSHCHFSCSPS